jgi:hypothetical protein
MPRTSHKFWGHFICFCIFSMPSFSNLRLLSFLVVINFLIQPFFIPIAWTIYKYFSALNFSCLALLGWLLLNFLALSFSKPINFIVCLAYKFYEGICYVLAELSLLRVLPNRPMRGPHSSVLQNPQVPPIRWTRPDPELS